jgi:hypothetical protein
MSTSAECRKYAQQCVELAKSARTAHHRAILLSIAEKWLSLANIAQREAEMIADNRDRAG